MAYTKTNWLDRAVGWARRFFMNWDGGNDKNLFPPFSDWALHANAVVTAPYTLTLTTFANFSASIFSVPVVGGQTYTISASLAKVSGTGTPYIYGQWYDANGVLISQPTNLTGSSLQWVAPSNAVSLSVGCTNNATSGTTVFTFTNPQLELGSVATAFAPKKMYTITQSPGTVTQAGTPINAANLNKMEQGIYDAHVTADAALKRDGTQFLGIADTRAVVTTPNTYNTAGVKWDFKTAATAGLPVGVSFAHVMGLRGWSDSSGGDAYELAFAGSGNKMYKRSGSTTTWNAWDTIWDTSQMRVHSSGTYIEWFNGTTWLGVGGVKNIQRGLYTANPGVNNVTISAVSSLAKASVNYLTTNNSWQDSSSGTSSVSIRLTSTTNLEITNGLNGVATAPVSWEVIEYY